MYMKKIAGFIGLAFLHPQWESKSLPASGDKSEVNATTSRNSNTASNVDRMML